MIITCLERKRQAGLLLDSTMFHSVPESRIVEAREILSAPSCTSCSNPLVRKLGLDDMLCEKKGE